MQLAGQAHGCDPVVLAALGALESLDGHTNSIVHSSYRIKRNLVKKRRSRVASITRVSSRVCGACSAEGRSSDEDGDLSRLVQRTARSVPVPVTRVQDTAVSSRGLADGEVLGRQELVIIATVGSNSNIASLYNRLARFGNGASLYSPTR